jgi:hypothetical protein
MNEAIIAEDVGVLDGRIADHLPRLDKTGAAEPGDGATPLHSHQVATETPRQAE